MPMLVDRLREFWVWYQGLPLLDQLTVIARIIAILMFIAGVVRALFIAVARSRAWRASLRARGPGVETSEEDQEAYEEYELVSRLIAHARLQSDIVLNELTNVAKRYLPELYANRARVEEDFERHLASDKIGYALIGSSGIGKTNIFCYLAEKLRESNIVLLYSGNFLRQHPRDPVFQLETQIRRDLEIPDEDDFYEFLAKLDKGCEKRNCFTLIMIDAINKYVDPVELLRSINQVVGSLTGSRIRIAFSCRDHVWNYLYRATPSPVVLYESRFFNFADGDIKGTYVTEFTESELAQAYRSYQRHYQLKTSFNNLSDHTIESCKNPLMLRLICEVYRGQEIPDYVPALSVFELYYEAKVEHSWDMVRFLEFIIRSMRNNQDDQLPRSLVFEELERRGYRIGNHGNPYSVLLDEAIVFEYAHGPEVLVRVTYDKFFEYMLCRELLRGDVLANLDGLVKEAAEFDPIRGALESVVLYCEREQPGKHVEILGTLAGLDQSWKEFVCLAAPKLGSLTEETKQLLLELANDPEYWVRWAASYALREVLRRRPHFLTDLTQWRNNEAWQIREAVANALAGVSGNPEQAIQLLYELAKDEHWRVRRVVAFSLGEIGEVFPEVSASLFERWVTDPDWRVREAVARSPRSVSRTYSRSLALLRRLSDDEEPIVRRAVARSLGMVAPAEPDQCIDLLAKLSTDDSWWVRKTVVRSIQSVVPAFPMICLHVLRGLSGDSDDGVRWGVARAFRRFRSEGRMEALDILKPMVCDKVQYIAEAAAFSIAHLTDSDPQHIVAEMMGGDAGFSLVNEQVYESTLDLSGLRVAHPEELTRRWVRDEYLSIQVAIARLAGQEGTEGYVRALQRLAADEDEGIRWEVANIIGELQTVSLAEGFELLELLSSDRHYWIRRAVAESVGKLTAQDPSKATSLLYGLASDNSEEVRLHVAKSAATLAGVAPGEAIDILSRLAEHSTVKAECKDTWVRRAIVDALASTASEVPRRSFELLRGFWHDPDTWTKRALARALGEFASDNAAEALKLLRLLESSSDEEVRRRARSSIGRIVTTVPRAEGGSD